MPDWEKAVQGLREQFLRGSGERLARMTGALERLEADRSDVDALRELRTEFHGFSGLGGTFGFPQVTALGLEGEKRCDGLLSSATAPGSEDIATWRANLVELRAQIGRAPTASKGAEDGLRK